MTRRLALLLGILIACVVGAGVWWWSRDVSASTAWHGYAEADYVKVGPTQQGLLTEVNVARGTEVGVGTPLFVQDETADRAARDQAARQLQQAEDQLPHPKAGEGKTGVAAEESVSLRTAV